MHRQHGDSEELMSEKAKACFVLPLRESAAHFACRNGRSAETGGSANDGNTHASIDRHIHRLGNGVSPIFLQARRKVS
jgi:hypothetical protein